MRRDDLLGICEKICAAAERRGLEAEAYAAWNKNITVEIENTEINFSSTDIDSGVGVRVIKDGRMGFAYTDSPRKPVELIERAAKLAPLGREARFRFQPKRKYRFPRRCYDSRIVDLDPDEAFTLTRDMLETALDYRKGIEAPTGGVLANCESVAIASTRGLEAEDESTLISAWLSTVFGDEEKTTGFESAGSRNLDIKPTEIGREAARVAVETQGGIEIKGGKMDVVFRPRAMAEILSATFVPALNGERAATGESYLSGQLGRIIMSRKITIRDHGLLAAGVDSSPFDDEGVPSRNNKLVENGKLRMFLYDVASAIKYGARSTGNGLRGGYRSMPSPSAKNLVFEGKDRPFDKVIGSVDRGILVNEVMGAHTANPVSTEFSVNTASLFLIEKGGIAGPVGSAMISGKVADMLKRLMAMADDRRPLIGDATFYMPSMCFSDLNVTG